MTFSQVGHRKVPEYPTTQSDTHFVYEFNRATISETSGPETYS